MLSGFKSGCWKLELLKLGGRLEWREKNKIYLQMYPRLSVDVLWVTIRPLASENIRWPLLDSCCGSWQPVIQLLAGGVSLDAALCVLHHYWKQTLCDYSHTETLNITVWSVHDAVYYILWLLSGEKTLPVMFIFYIHGLQGDIIVRDNSFSLRPTRLNSTMYLGKWHETLLNITKGTRVLHQWHIVIFVIQTEQRLSLFREQFVLLHIEFDGCETWFGHFLTDLRLDLD